MPVYNLNFNTAFLLINTTAGMHLISLKLNLCFEIIAAFHCPIFYKHACPGTEGG